MLALISVTSVLAQDKATVAKTTKVSEDEQLHTFLDEHFPGMTAKLDSILKNEGIHSYNAVRKQQVIILKHYNRTLNNGGKDMAKLVIEQNSLANDMLPLLNEFESLAEDDPKRAEIRVKLEPVFAQYSTISGKWAEFHVASMKNTPVMTDLIKTELARQETRIKTMDALRENPKKVFDDYLVDRKATVKAAIKFKEKIPANWHTDPKKALAASKKSGKPVHVFFSTSWCAPCKVIFETVYPQDAVKEKLTDFELLYVDVDLYSTFTTKCRVDRFPCFIIMNAEQKVLHRSDNHEISTEEFLDWITHKK